MAKDKAAKAAARESKKDKNKKGTSVAAEPATAKPNGKTGSSAKAGPSSENSTVTSKTPDKSSKKNKVDKKGKNKAVDEPQSAKGAAADDVDENAILLREIKSFGGTEEDFELLKDVDTDDEDVAEAEVTAEDVRKSVKFGQDCVKQLFSYANTFEHRRKS